MKINGIGNVPKKEVLSILTKEGKQAAKSGLLTNEDLANMYKYEMSTRESKIGKFPHAFQTNYNKIPATICDKLSPAEIAQLVDLLHDNYQNGKAAENCDGREG